MVEMNQQYGQETAKACEQDPVIIIPVALKSVYDGAIQQRKESDALYLAADLSDGIEGFTDEDIDKLRIEATKRFYAAETIIKSTGIKCPVCKKKNDRQYFHTGPISFTQLKAGKCDTCGTPIVFEEAQK